jgi:hypothetical protein
VEEVVDALERLPVLLRDAEQRRSEIADDRDDASLARGPARLQLFKSRERALAHEHVDGPLPLEQALDQVPANETGGPGDEVLHLSPINSPLD